MRSVVHGEPVKNVEALANPATLDEFRARLNCNPDQGAYVDGSSQNCSLLVVDVQASTAAGNRDGEAVLRNCVWLAGVARRVGVPVVVFSTNIQEALAAPPIRCWRRWTTRRSSPGRRFSCVADGCLDGTAVDSRQQVVVVGTEAHVRCCKRC